MYMIVQLLDETFDLIGSHEPLSIANSKPTNSIEFLTGSLEPTLVI